MKTLFLVKGKISTLGCKIRRYEKQRRSIEQNNTFQSDKKKFYRSLFEDENIVKEPPKEDEIRKFWSEKIWGDATKYNGQPKWYAEVEKNYKNITDHNLAYSDHVRSCQIMLEHVR